MLYLPQQKLGLTLVKNDLRGAVSAIIKTPEEIDAILDEQLVNPSSAESLSSETTAYGKSSSTSDVDKAFDELMSNK